MFSKPHKHIYRWTLCLLLACQPAFLNAAVSKGKIQDRQQIRDTARQYASSLALQDENDQQTKIVVGRLDKRLKLVKCTAPLQAFESPNTKSVGKTTIGVRCDGDKTWKLYVPVDIQIIKKVATLIKPVTRNTILQASDISFKDMNIASLHQGYYTHTQALIGKHTKNALRAGTVLTPSQLKNPMAIKKGALVTIMADLGGIQVRMKGKALKSGALGDWIAVQNLSSNRKIEGRIMSDGVIRVTL